MEPIIKPLACPGCQKTVNVRVTPSASEHTFQCPNCKAVKKVKT